jgi:uncharacterized protein YecT (DUF1311 family)
MNRRVPLFVVLILGAIAVILMIALVRQGPRANPDKLQGAESSKAMATSSDRCASQRTYDRIKDELFRRAVQVRGGDRAAIDPIASYASVRVERPLLTNFDQQLGTQRCSGHLSLDLPPGVQVVGGRRTLLADIDYVLQPAADGSGDVVMLEGADPIIVPLATISRTGASTTAAETTVPEEQDTGTAPSRAAEPAPKNAAPAPAVTRVQPKRGPQPVAAHPSFNCRYARTGSEIAVCNDSELAALDRQMSTQYYRAIENSDARQRRLLAITRDKFLRFRDRCSSKACIADTYRGRMREIRHIATRE